MVKGMKKFIRPIILDQMGTFENKRIRYIERYDVYGTTVTMPMYEGDEVHCSIHLYYSDVRAVKEKQRGQGKDPEDEETSGCFCRERKGLRARI